MSAPVKGKDTLMRLLLSSNPIATSTSSIQQVSSPTSSTRENLSRTSSSSSGRSDSLDEDSNPLTSYVRQLGNEDKEDMSTVRVDHCYCRWNWRSENSFLRPTKHLFMPYALPAPSSHAARKLASVENSDEELDVEGTSEGRAPVDMSHMRHAMLAVERHVRAYRVEDEGVDWEERISKYVPLLAVCFVLLQTYLAH